MKKHKIAYIDERKQDIKFFKRQVFGAFDVSGYLPKPGLDDFVEDLLSSGVEAIVADFRLNEYREDVKEPIDYTGADLIKKVLEMRRDFPCFVLTSYDDHAIQETRDVNYVYSKDLIKLDPKKPRVGKTTLLEKIRIQIEHYQSTLEEKAARFDQLLKENQTRDLSEKEESELLKLDAFLESALHDHNALPPEKKNQLAVGKIDELIDSTNRLLDILKKREK